MQYFEPHFLGEALVLLERFGKDARVLAGGTRVGFALRESPANIAAVVNLKRIDGLSAIVHRNDELHIGALVTAAQLRRDSLVRAHAPLLARAAGSMGARQLQTLATVGGNVCSYDPCSDLAVALLASDASTTIASAREGSVHRPLADILSGDGHGLQPDALVTEFAVPTSDHRWSYQRMTTRRTFEMPLVAVALQCLLHADVVARVQVALAGAAPRVVRSAAAEAALIGKPLDATTAAAAGRAAADSCDPVDDQRAGARYRRALVAVLVQRAVLAANSRHFCTPHDGAAAS